MFDIFAFFTLRTIIIMFSTTISIAIVMLMANIITVDKVITIFGLSEEPANALRTIVERMQEVFSNILNILSQLINKLFSWAGVDVDLSQIDIDVHNNVKPVAKPVE